MILPYAYGTIIHTIRVWLYHMRIRVWYVPYAYGIKYAYGIEHHQSHYITDESDPSSQEHRLKSGYVIPTAITSLKQCVHIHYIMSN